MAYAKTGRSARLGALLTTLLLVSAALVGALASSAQAYPDQVCSVTVNPQKLVGGKTFVVTANSPTSVHWKMQFLSQSATGTGKSLTHRFHTPKVTHKTVTDLKVTVTSTPVTSPRSAAKAAGVSCGLIHVTLDPPTGSGHHPHQGNASPPVDHNGVLPGTGGPALWILLLGLALAVAGAATAMAKRRES